MYIKAIVQYIIIYSISHSSTTTTYGGIRQDTSPSSSPGGGGGKMQLALTGHSLLSLYVFLNAEFSGQS